MARADDPGASPPAGRRLPPDDAQDFATPPWTTGAAATAAGSGAGTEEDQEIWLLSYSDLVTLLLSVFVMLLAITTLKDQFPTTPQPGTAVAASVAPAALPLFDEPDAVPAEPPDPRPRLDDGEVAVTAPGLVAARWRETLAALGMPRSVAVDVRQNRVGIVIGDGILFASGQAELTAGGDGLLRRLAPVLAAAGGDIVVEGHTDRSPIGTRRFPSNWELSGARAASVVRRLIELGIAPGRLSAVGYADTRPLDNGADPAAQARNRRVAISLRADGLPPNGTAPAAGASRAIP